MESRILYAEINLICIAIVLYEIYKAARDIDKSYTWKKYIYCMAFSVLAFASDMVWALLPETGYPLWQGYLACIIYFISLLAAAVIWFFYSETIQGSGILKKKWIVFITIIPAAFLVVLLFTGKIFTLDETGYHRASLYPLQVIISFGYILFTGVRAIYHAFQKENYVKKDEYLSLGAFVVLPVLSMIPQWLLNGAAPMTCVGIALATMIVYQNHQQNLISKDPLTGLNNRNQVLQYLSSKMKSDDNNLYLMIMDADGFKQINDTYGHAEGDSALTLIADALKKAVPQHFIIARYGGDEFVAIGEAESDQAVEQIRDSIYRQIEKDNVENNTPWAAEISIGFALRTDKENNIPDLIRKADKKLYEEKKAKKSENK